MSSNGRRRDISEQARMRVSVSEAIKQITRRKRWINAEKQRLQPSLSSLLAARGISLAGNSHGVTYSFTVVVI